MKKAIILDDHLLFADAFSMLLETYQLFDEVQSFHNIRNLVDFLVSSNNRPVYIFLDYYLRGENGLSVFSEIKRLNKNAFVIFITSATSSSVLNNILQYRPDGILSKFCSITDLMACLKSIESDILFLDEDVQMLIKNGEGIKLNFTPREIELLKHFANGHSIAETAEKTFLSTHTVIAHRRKMMAKANCHSIGQLLKLAKDHEII